MLILSTPRVAAAQVDDPALLRVAQGVHRAAVAVPPEWNLLPVRANCTVEARLNPATDSADTQRATLRLAPLAAPFGELPAADPLRGYMDLLIGILPSNAAEYAPHQFSEVVRFQWGDFPAALVLAYAPATANGPAYYARWFAVQVDDDTALLLQLGTTLPAGAIPDARTATLFDRIAGTLTINNVNLPRTAPQAALRRATPPDNPDEAPVAALRLANGPEVRLVGPQSWQRRPVTQSRHYPSVYFFQRDLRGIPPGDNPGGPYMQISLVGTVVLQERLARLETPPDTTDLNLAYLNALLVTARPDIQFGTPTEFRWGEDYPALLWPLRFGERWAGHLLLVTVDDALVQVSFYAPLAEWGALEPAWASSLASMLINDVAVSPETLARALEIASFEPPQIDISPTEEVSP